MGAAPSLNDLPAPPPGKTGWPWTEESPPLPEEQRVGSPYPRISVVTPSYNQGAFLEETIRSVLLQGYPDLEYIVIDGGSTDESVRIIREYEPWITYWVSEPDSGQTDAINKGISKASGDILAWLNSDDFYCPEALRRVGRYVAASPHIDLLYGDCEMVDGSGSVYDRFNVRPGDVFQLLGENFIAQPSAFWTRAAWEKAGGLDERLHYVMDYDLWLRMLAGGMTAVYFPTVLSRFRYHDASKSRVELVPFGREYLDVLDKISVDARDERLLQAILQAYHRTFEAIVDMYEQTAADGRELHDSLSGLLRLWIDHLRKFRSRYRVSRRLLAESYFRVAYCSCLLGHMNTGRYCFTKAILADRGLFRETLFWWLTALGGQRSFKWYLRRVQAGSEALK
jgi:glycosyltransferase involved in cell wall biosynthesis